MARLGLDEAYSFPSYATLDQVEHWLSMFVHCTYNGDGAFEHNGTYYKYDCQAVGSLNARYHELTGQNYPGYTEKQYEMSKFFKHKERPRSRVYKDIAVDLKKNEHSKMFLTTSHPIYRLNDIMLNLGKATAEEIAQILEVYQAKKYLVSGQADLKPIIIDGHFCSMHYEPLTAAALNGRYRELTGHDYPTYAEEQRRVIKKLIKEERQFGGLISLSSPYAEILKRLDGKESDMEILSSSKDYIPDGAIDVNPQDYGLEAVDKYLKYLNQKTLVSGIVTYGGNDPLAATKVNARYRELTGHDHPQYTAQIESMIKSYLEDRELIEPYLKPGYFSELEAIASNLGISVVEESKKR